MFRQEKKINAKMPPVQQGLTGGKRILKCLVVFAFCLLFCFGSCITAFADVPSGATSVNGININSVWIRVYDTTDGDYRNISLSSKGEFVDEERIRLVIRNVDSYDSGNFKKGKSYAFELHLDVVDSKYQNTSLLTKIDYRLAMSTNCQITNSDLNYFRFSSIQYGNINSSLPSIDSDNGSGRIRLSNKNAVDIVYPYSRIDYYYHSFSNFVSFKCDYNTDYITLNITNIDWSVVTPEEYEEKIISENAENIMQNQDENTQAIIDNQNQLSENEKQEATDTGDEGVGDVANAIPNYGGNLLSLMGHLTSQICHQKTDCGFNTPAIKIPVIEPYIKKEITLMSPKWIGFDKVFNKMNYQWGNVFDVIRAILTIALIIYCVKELYSIIEYVLTLRGGTDE